MLFQEPQYFYLSVLVPALVLFYLYVFSRKRALLNRFGEKDLVSSLLNGVNYPIQYLKAILIILAIFLLITALARPKWGAKAVTLKRKGVDIVFVVDASVSMLAEDIKPNRLERAKHEISSFIQTLKGDRLGLVIFAGSSYVACPLTLDYNAFNMFIDVIDPSLMKRQGTRLGDAIKQASSIFVEAERKHKAMIILTDGEDHDNDAITAAEEAAKTGIRIYTVGIGRQTGEPIPVKNSAGVIEGYKKDRYGNVVVSRLDERTLKMLALKTSGKYYHSEFGEMGLDEIYKDISKMDKKELRSEHLSRYEDRFQIFCVFVLTLLLLEMFISERVFTKNKRSDSLV